MARNKYPEQTVARILDAAQKLFLEKGYENTSIQDIIDEAGGITKGAIYHHFKSKQQIFVAVNERFDDVYNDYVDAVAKDKTLTGPQKLREMLRISVSSNVQIVRFSAHINLLQNPKLLSSLIEGLQQTVPAYITPVLQQCIAEGAVTIQSPEEIAELILFVLNTWLNPMLFQVSQEQMVRRLALMERLLQGIGLDILDDDIKEKFMNLNETYNNSERE